MPMDEASHDVIDQETALGANAKLQLHVWLRMLTCTQLIERRIRAGLRKSFNTTLPRFDALSQIEAAGGVLSMGELSGRLMVTSGNVTGLIDSMEKDGLVIREPHPEDRRSILIQMTAKGDELFSSMVPWHRKEIDQVMRVLNKRDMRELLDLLGKLKSSARTAQSDGRRT